MYKEKNIVEDDHCIDPKNALDIRYWSVILKTTPGELKEAIKKTGISVAEVKKFLNTEDK